MPKKKPMNEQLEMSDYPNQMGRIFLVCLEEVIGKAGVDTVLNQANLSHLIDDYPQKHQEQRFKFEDISAILQTLEEIYGQRGGRGLAQRTGRVCTKLIVREYGPVLGFSDLAFRLLPSEDKLHTCINIIADIFNRFYGQIITLDEDNDYYYWDTERCPLCWGRTSEVPLCYLTVGLIEEAAYWVSNGKTFNVVETACVAMGDRTCRISITKQPLDQ